VAQRFQTGKYSYAGWGRIAQRFGSRQYYSFRGSAATGKGLGEVNLALIIISQNYA
jgi:hypothetical protein